MRINIGRRLVSQKSSPFIIAECGINHNGEIERAFEMIRLAKNAGADAVKFQTFRAEEFVGDSELMFTYRSRGKEVTESMLEMFRRYEFNKDEWKLIKRKCDEEEILFLSTPQNESDLDLLIDIGISAIKVGSDDFTNIPLLKDYASVGLPLIISCGMADMAEVHRALEAVGALEGNPTILMLCTSEYPTPPEDVNLLKLNTLRSAYPMITVGFSDHTQGPIASSVAVALGAKVFEKHFTLDHTLPGPDHWFSEDPVGLKEWIRSIRIAWRMMGSGIVQPTTNERRARPLARRSVFVLSDIAKGDRLTRKNIGLRRPGTGLPPSIYENLLGARVSRDVKAGALLNLQDIDNSDSENAMSGECFDNILSEVGKL